MNISDQFIEVLKLYVLKDLIDMILEYMDHQLFDDWIQLVNDKKLKKCLSKDSNNKKSILLLDTNLIVKHRFSLCDEYDNEIEYDCMPIGLKNIKSIRTSKNKLTNIMIKSMQKKFCSLYEVILLNDSISDFNSSNNCKIFIAPIRK